MQAQPTRLFTAQLDHEQDNPDVEVDVKTLDQFLKEMHSDTVKDDSGMPGMDWLRSQFKTKSAVIRFLDSKGFKPKAIAAHMNIRQQHVRNVLGQELKRGPNEAFDIETKWGCSHEKSAKAFIDIVLRKSLRDTNSSRVLLRVCSDCASGFLPGVDSTTLEKHLPGLLVEDKDKDKVKGKKHG